MGVSLALGTGLGDECHATHEQAHPDNVLPHHLREVAFARGSVAKVSASPTALLEHWGNPAARQMRAVIVSISAISFTSRRPSDLRLHVVFHMRNNRTVRAVSPFD